MSTPSKGALRAAKLLFPLTQWHMQLSDLEWAEVQLRDLEVKAQVIDEHTGTAELLAALKKSRQFIASEWGEDECEFIDILLTKHTTP